MNSQDIYCENGFIEKHFIHIASPIVLYDAVPLNSSNFWDNLFLLHLLKWFWFPYQFSSFIINAWERSDWSANVNMRVDEFPLREGRGREGPPLSNHMIIFLTATSCQSKKKHETLYVLVYFKVFYVIRVSHWLTAVHEKDSFFFKRGPFILSWDRVTGPAESVHSHPVQSVCGSLLSRGGDAGWESSLSCGSWGAFALVLIVPDRSLSNPAQLWQAAS